MPDTEKAENLDVKKQPPRPTPDSVPIGLVAGLETPRSPHC
jgi:hypothetical protein